MLTEQLVKIALFGAEWVLYLLIFLSVLSIALMIERAIYFRRRRAALMELESEFQDLNDNGEASAWAQKLEHGDQPERLMLRRLLAVIRSKSKAPPGLVESATSQYTQLLERYLSVLGTLGSNAPFIGLFGTVIGIIKAFQTLSENIDSGANAVMGDISEALIATAAGLAVAIPAVIAYNYYMRLTEAYSSRFSALGQNLNAMNGDFSGKGEA